MLLKELIKELSQYNGDAEVAVVVNGRSLPFGICYGGSEACTKTSCEHISLVTDTDMEAES